MEGPAHQSSAVPSLTMATKPSVPPKGSIIVRSSDALAIEYRQKLTPMIRAMSGQIYDEIMPIYRAHREMQRRRMVGDASVVELLMQALSRLRARWQHHTDDRGRVIATTFVEKVDDHVQASFIRQMRDTIGDDEDIPAPAPRRLKGADLQTATRAAVAENVGLITSIPQEYLDGVQVEVLQAVQNGWPLDRLSEELRQRYGVTKRRADLIARDQCSKVTEDLKGRRMIAAGFTEATWWHSAGSRFPRKLHQEANGKRFKIEDGLMIGGKMTKCGQEINCFPGETLIDLAQGCHEVWRYYYRGEIVAINSGSGIIRSTPNHPLLTDGGWVAAQSVKKGDYVWKARRKKFDPGVSDENQTEFMIGDVFDALASIGSVSVQSGVIFNFHGDIPDAEVEAVRPESLLPGKSNPGLAKCVRDFLLANPDRGRGFATTHIGEILHPPFSGAGSDVSSALGGGVLEPQDGRSALPSGSLTQIRQSFGNECSRSTDSFGDALHAQAAEMQSNDVSIQAIIGRRTGFNPGGRHAPGDGLRRNSKVCSNIFDGMPCPVEFGQLHRVDLYQAGRFPALSRIGDVPVSAEVLAEFIRTYAEVTGQGFYCDELFMERCCIANEPWREDYSGHVYTMQSDCGYYSASTEKIITKNCKCFFTPIVPGRG